MRIAPAITLSPEQRTVLESQARSRSLPVRVAERARIVLFAASGLQDKKIARPHGDYAKKGFPMAQAFSRAGRGGVAKRRAPARPHAQDRPAPTSFATSLAPETSA